VKALFDGVMHLPVISIHILILLAAGSLLLMLMWRAYRELGSLRKNVEKRRHTENKLNTDLTSLQNLIASKNADLTRAEERIIATQAQAQEQVLHIENRFSGLKQRNEIITNYSGSGVLEIDTDLNIIYANQKAREILGVPSRRAPYVVGYSMKTFPLFQNTDIVIGLASLYKGKKIAINVEVLDNLNRPRILHVESFALQTEGKFSGAYLLINDITQQIFAEEKLHQAITMQKNSLEDMINIIIAISGVRDPYTAGHQRRVSELAVEIGRQMKLDAHTLHGIEITAKVHDIGKVSVPSELLTRPGKISDMEHSVIKQHSEVGYNILKSIKSPWPIADIVRQHHEHLDGTGYPQGLHGDQIRLESRIITIADIVEAINSHRPYRPSLGLDVALKAINEHKGVRYDAQVIEACETVIEQGFEFSDAF
jgi:HD-GYP domain-containing protein (c-di-GMP phosphodiesterase class II)